MADKKIIASLEVQTGQSRQNIAAVSDELAKQGDVGVKSADQITNALRNIENASANVLKKEQDGRAVTERDGNVLLQQYRLLEQAVNQFVAANGTIPPALHQALTTANAQFDLAKEKIQTATTATKQQRDELTQAGAQWTGLGGAINQALGPQGKVIAQAGLVIAAFKEGIDIGTKFGEVIGTNFSAAASAVDGLKRSVAGVTNALVTDGPIEASKQWAASLTTLSDTLFGTGRAIDGVNVLIEQGVDRLDAAKLSTEQKIAVDNAHRLAVQGGADALKFFDDILRDNKGNLDAAVAVLQAATPALKTYAERMKAATQVVQVHTDELKHQLEQEQKLIDKHDDEIRKITELVGAIGTEDGARKALHATVGGEINDLATLDVAQRGTSESIGEVATTVARLTQDFDANQPAIDKEIARLQSLKSSTVGLSDETKKHIDEMTQARQSVASLTEQNQQLEDRQAALLTSGKASTAQGIEQVHAIDGQISANNHLIAVAKEKLASNAQLLASNKELAGRTGDLKTVVGDLAATFKQTDENIDAHRKNVVELTKAVDNLTSSYGKLKAAQDLLTSKGQGLQAPSGGAPAAGAP